MLFIELRNSDFIIIKSNTKTAAEGFFLSSERASLTKDLKDNFPLQNENNM